MVRRSDGKLEPALESFVSSLRMLGLSLEHSAAGEAGLLAKLVSIVQAGDLSLAELSTLQGRKDASERV